MADRPQACLRILTVRVGVRARCALLLTVSLVALVGCAPDVPHPAASQTDEYCRQCHVGRAGAPASHDKSGCVSCHAADTIGVYPACMPHRGGETERCRLCHADGIIEAPKARHLNESDCYTCHQSLEYGPWPPTLSHEISDTSPAKCLECHQDLSHADRPNCVGCHAL
jgi:hypothetical protein